MCKMIESSKRKAPIRLFVGFRYCVNPGRGMPPEKGLANTVVKVNHMPQNKAQIDKLSEIVAQNYVEENYLENGFATIFSMQVLNDG